MGKRIGTVLAIVFGTAAISGAALASEPQKLSDAELDGVTAGAPPAFVLAAGHGPPWAQPTVTNIGTQVNIVFKDVTLTFNIGPGADVNLATTLQLALLSSQPQVGSATAVQTAGHH